MGYNDGNNEDTSEFEYLGIISGPINPPQIESEGGRVGRKTLSRKEIEKRARDKEQAAIKRLERAVRPWLGDMKIRGRADLIQATVGVVEWLVMQHNHQGAAFPQFT